MSASAERSSLESSGPWYDVPGEYGMSAIIDRFGHKVADVMCPSDGPVLAAAPDLLAALFGLLHTCELNTDDMEPETRNAIKAAAAAIAKAKGAPPA